MVTLNYSPQKFDEYSSDMSPGEAFLPHVALALKFLNRLYSSERPLSLNVLGDMSGSKSQVAVQ